MSTIVLARPAVPLAAFATGLVFGIGLTVSRMIDPAKVLGFLDIAGDWDPSLALVMAGAVAVTFAGYRLVLRRPAPVLDERFHLPSGGRIDGPLLAGAVLFGVGWGLVGLCPGPSLAALGLGSGSAALFVAAMAAGMVGFRLARPLLAGGPAR